MSRYFDELTVRLRAAGVPAERVADTVRDLRAYLEDSGTDPEEEFGPAAAFAERLASGGEPADGGPASGERWVWTADIFVDQRRLNEFGEQGWEVESVDRLGRFVSTRNAERPQRWEYRREVVAPAERDALTERLAPDGWEPCGTWFFYAYYKRPKAALVGPEAELGAPPPQPGRRIFFSGRFYAFFVTYLLAMVVIVISVPRALTGSSIDSDPSTIVGMLTGACTVIAVFVAALYLGGRRRRGR